MQTHRASDHENRSSAALNKDTSWLNTPIDTQFLTCRIGLAHFQSGHVSCCRLTHAASSAEKHRSQSTDPEPFKRNVLFSVRDVFSKPCLRCFSVRLLNLIWPQCNRPPCSSFWVSTPRWLFWISLHVYVCEHLTLCTCVWTHTPLFLPYVCFNLKSVLVAMETPLAVPLVGNNGLEYCTLYFIALQTSRKHLNSLQLKQCVAWSYRFMFSATSFLCILFSQIYSIQRIAHAMWIALFHIQYFPPAVLQKQKS